MTELMDFENDSSMIPSFLDGFRVDPLVMEENPSKSCFDEFQRQLNLPNNAQRIEEALIKEPDGSLISYKELNCLIANICRNLEQNGCTNSNKPVAVFLPPSCQRIAALLALDYLGVPFLPLDPVQNPDQRNYILNHSEAQAVLAPPDSLGEVASWVENKKVKVIGCEKSVHFEECHKIYSNLVVQRNEDGIFLTLYTSGSTGVPKGVMLTDANLLNRLRWQWAELPFAKDGSDVCLAKTNNLFVDSYTEILGAVLRLQKLVIVDPNAWKSSKKDVAELMVESVEENQVTRLILVPSLLRTLLEMPNANHRLRSLRFVVSSGEALPAELAKQFFKILGNNSIRLANFYGSTEVTGDITAAVFASEADVAARTVGGFLSIGRPVHNTTIFILREDTLKPVSFGKVGCIFVGGANVCHGFVGETKLVNRFALKPQEFHNVGDGDRLMNMGDLGRIVPGGELFYCGRSDSIVKVRGNRVSTAQVETALKEVLEECFQTKPPASHQRPRLKVLGLLNSNSATYRLGAFYEVWPESEQCLIREVIRKKLSSRLSYYAVPELLFPLQMGDFPLQPATGKTDLRALKQLAADRIAECSLTQSDIENIKVKPGDLEMTMDAVKKVTAFSLDISPNSVDMEANFFEQGGNSLSVVSAVASMKKIGLNATAELLLSKENSLNEVAKKLCIGNFSECSMPDWLELKSIVDLTPEEMEHTIQKIDYTFAVNEPLGQFLDVKTGALLHVIHSLWKDYVNSGPIAFVALDKRRNGLASIVGSCLSADATMEDANPADTWKGIEAIYQILSASIEPAILEVLKEFDCEHFTKGVVVEQRMMHVDPDISGEDAAAVFMALERGLIDRSRKAGYKMIMTENTSLATQRIERDILGYKTRFSLKAADFQTPDGQKPFQAAPQDYHVIAMTLDL